jgi:hypothetical protein
MSWREILEPAPPAAEAEADPIGFCLGRADLLNEWERRFLRSIQRQRYRQLSDKQIRILRKLVGKCWGSP